MEERCVAEVEELHRFFEEWFAGTVEPTGKGLQRFTAVLAEEFELISPDGRQTGRGALIGRIRKAHGTHRDRGLRNVVEAIRVRAVGPALYLVHYEEWQQRDGCSRGRLSSALLRERADTPNGLEWVHVQETWLPR